MLIPVFFISFAAIGWQLALMRCLLLSRYHHFSFLVISCALLGFGVGGVALSLKRSWFEEHPVAVLTWGIPCFALSLPMSLLVGEQLPVNVYFAPSVLLENLGWWCLFWFIHGVPFFLAGLLIGLALISAGPAAHKVYASNLVGSAAGALAAILLMDYVAPSRLSVPFAISVLASGFFFTGLPKSRGTGIYFSCLAIGAVLLSLAYFVAPGRVFRLHIDQYKPLAHVLRLAAQGDARKKVTLHGPRGQVDLFSGPHFHTMMSLSPVVAPPTMSMLLRDGFAIGSVLSITSIDEARFLESTLSALPYKLLRPRRILILGATGGKDVWLARLSGAQSIVVVEPDDNIIRVLRDYGHGVLDDPRVHVVVSEPRAFLDRVHARFDIIHLAALEGFAAGSAGIAGLREDYLATVQGFARCLDGLAADGIACVVRGIQDPARDNIKIAATWIEALESKRIAHSGNHVLLARDELAIATLVGKSSSSQEVVARFPRAIRSMSWDTDWCPGLPARETNRVHVLPGPPGTRVSWYHHAMRELLSRDRERFYGNWICNVRPATDDKPFFYDFFRWASVGKLRDAFGPLWPARAEMGFLVLILSVLLTSILAALMLPAPVLLLGGGIHAVRTPLILWTICYFGALGMGFMFIEMGFIQMFTRFLGDPILAAALVVAGLLFFAGMGSMNQPRVIAAVPGGTLAVTVVVAIATSACAELLPRLFEATALLSGAWKVFAGLTVLAPLAFLMGMPFPWGLSALRHRAAEAVPVAWAVNGFASVVSASIAVVLAMSVGFTSLLLFAALMYALAGILSVMLRARDAHARNT